MAAMSRFETLLSIFPSVPPGYLLKIYGNFKTLCSENKAEAIESDTDTVPVSESDSSFTPSDEFDTSSTASTSAEDLRQLKSTRPVPKSFPIGRCNFGYNAKQLIRTGTITELGKREITTELIHVMHNYEKIPSRLLRKKAVNALLKLGKANLGLGEEEAHSYWLKKITQKLNTQQKKLRQLQNAPKTKRAYNNAAGVSDTNFVKRKKHKDLIIITDNEEETMNNEKQILLDEMQKPKGHRNKKIITDLMASTFRIRRSFVFNENPNPTAMRKDWPAMFIYEEVIREFQRIEPSVVENIQTSLVIKKVITFAESKDTKSQRLKHVMGHLPIVDAGVTDVHLAVAVWILCVLLVSNTKKQHNSQRYLLDLCPANTTFDDAKREIGDRHQPVAIILGDIESPSKIFVMAEGVVFFEVNSVSKALLAVFAVYYAMNYSYCPHVAKVLQFLQKYVLNLNTTTEFDSVQELALKLDL